MELRHSTQRRGDGILSCAPTIAIVIMMKHWYVHSSLIRRFVRMVTVKMTFHTEMMMMIIGQSVHFYSKLPLLG